jgi:ribosomal protein L40E
MNKALGFIVLFLVGISLSIIFGNFLITTLACFLLGLVLNKKWKSIRKPQSKLVDDKSRRCIKCSRKNVASAEYCASCGSKLSLLENNLRINKFDPEYIIMKLRDIIEKDEESYYWFVKDLLFLDEKESYWSIDAETLQWYRYKDKCWIADSPEGMLTVSRRSDGFLEDTMEYIDEETLSPQEDLSGNICLKCKTVNDLTDTFCSECGNKLEKRKH